MRDRITERVEKRKGDWQVVGGERKGTECKVEGAARASTGSEERSLARSG